MAAVQADVLLAFEVFSPAMPQRHVYRQYTWLTAVSARAGALKPDQVFVLAHVPDAGQCGVGQSRFDGMLLDLTFEKYVRCKKDYLPIPAGETPVGRLMMFLSDPFASHLLSVFDEHNMSPTTVVINKLLFEDVTPKRVRVTGMDLSFEQIVVTASGTSHQDESEGPPVGQPADGPLMEPSDADQPDAADAMDLLSLLDGGSEPPTAPPAKKRKTRQNPAPTAGAGEGHVQETAAHDADSWAFVFCF